MSEPIGDQFGDMVVGHVKTFWHLDRLDPRRSRCSQILVGNQYQRQLQALCCTIKNILDDARAGVGINPDMHGAGISLETGCYLNAAGCARQAISGFRIPPGNCR